MGRVLEFLNGQPRMRLLLLGFLSVALLGTLNYLTGYQISFSIFYLLPVAMIAWFVGWRAGILLSLAAAASWLLAELLAGSSYSHPAVPLWNTLVRLGFFLIVTYIPSTLRIARQNQESLTHSLAAQLGVDDELVRVDPDPTRRVLANLLNNAVYINHKPGTIRPRTSRRSLRLRDLVATSILGKNCRRDDRTRREDTMEPVGAVTAITTCSVRFCDRGTPGPPGAKRRTGPVDSRGRVRPIPSMRRGAA
jgi:hypothetical protein